MAALSLRRTVFVFFGRVGIAVLLAGAVATAGVVAVNHYIDARVAELAKLDVTTAAAPKGGANFLIVGSDTRAFVEDPEDVAAFGTETDTGPARSDTLMVLHSEGRRSFVVSFPRDLWVDIPGRGKGKINAAFNDGPQKVIDTFVANYSIDIHHYVEVDFATFEGIVDAIGAVPVWFPAPARDGLTGLSIPTGGCQLLDGPNALAYVRARHLELLDARTGKWQLADPVPDIGRIARQQDFVRRLGQLAVQRSLDNPRLAPQVVDRVLPNLRVDSSFDRRALNDFVRAFLGLGGSGLGSSLEFVTLPWTPGRAAGQDVLFPEQPAAGEVLGHLRSFEHHEAVVTTTAPPRKRDIAVRVLNGSGVSGAAATADAALSKRGFGSAGIGDDPRRSVAVTELRYPPAAEAKAHVVARSVPGAQLVADGSITGADVVLVLGRNFTGIGSATTAPPSSAPTTGAPASSATATAEAAC